MSEMGIEGRGEVEKEKKIIVEVGTEYGLPFFRIGNRKLEENEMYVSVDRERENAAKLTQKFIRRENIPNANVTLSDARAMPFRDGSVDEVVFNNVFGEVGIWAGPKYYEKFLEESARVLKPGGKVTITETYTPGAVPESMRVEVRRDNKVSLDANYFKKFGLSVYKKTGKSEEISEYHSWGGEFDTGNFQLVLTKD